MSNRTILTILTVVLALGVAEGVEAARDIYLIRVASAIGPGITEFVEQGIETASKENAACLIIELDTPAVSSIPCARSLWQYMPAKCPWWSMSPLVVQGRLQPV